MDGLKAPKDGDVNEDITPTLKPDQLLAKETGVNNELSPTLTDKDDKVEDDKKDDKSDDSTTVPDRTDDDDTDTSGKDDGTQDDSKDTDWKKRHGDAVRWAQNEKKARERAEAAANEKLTAFRKKYEDAGINFSELDQIIAKVHGDNNKIDGTPEGDNKMDTPNDKGNEGQKHVTVEQFNDVINRYNYETTKKDFADANPEFKDKDMQKLLDVEVTELAAKEAQSHGAVTSTFSTLINEAGKNVKKTIQKFRGEGEKKASEKRKRVDDASLPDGDSKVKEKGGDEDETTYNGKELVAGHRSNLDKIKNSKL